MTTLPAGRPLAGRWVRLEMLSEADLDEMYPILSDPAVYADGYVMHHCPESLADAHDLARSVFLADQGSADGKGGGRTAYAIRAAADGDLGRAWTLVGTSALTESGLRNESIHLGSTIYGSRWWGTQVNPEREVPGGHPQTRRHSGRGHAAAHEAGRRHLTPVLPSPQPVRHLARHRLKSGQAVGVCGAPA